MATFKTVAGVTAPADLFGKFFDPWDRAKRDAQELSEQRRHAEESERTFQLRWLNAYRSQGPDNNQIANQLMDLREEILRRFWDFWIDGFLDAKNTACWNFAAILLRHVCRNERAAIDAALRRCTMSMLNDMSIYHEDMLESLLAKSRQLGLPHTPPLNQPELRTVMPHECSEDKLRGDIRANRWRFAEQPTSKHQRNWRHEDDAIQAAVLMKIRRRFPKKIWSEIADDK